MHFNAGHPLLWSLLPKESGPILEQLKWLYHGEHENTDKYTLAQPPIQQQFPKMRNKPKKFVRLMHLPQGHQALGGVL